MQAMTKEIRTPIDGVIYPSAERAASALANGAWVASTVGECLRATAARCPERPAFISDEGTLTFRQLDETTDRLAAALLKRGLTVGDRAILSLSPSAISSAIGKRWC